MKKVFVCLLAVVMLLSLCACGSAEQPEQTAQTTTESVESTEDLLEDGLKDEGLVEFTVTVIHSDGSTKDFSYQTADKFVGMVLVENGLIKGNDGPYGLEITEVDGEKAVYNEDKAYWAIYVGEEYATTGIDAVPVEDGGSYKLEYTRG